MDPLKSVLHFEKNKLTLDVKLFEGCQFNNKLPMNITTLFDIVILKLSRGAGFISLIKIKIIRNSYQKSFEHQEINCLNILKNLPKSLTINNSNPKTSKVKRSVIFSTVIV